MPGAGARETDADRGGRMTDREPTEQRLEALRAEHQALDARIDALAGQGDDLEIKGLKRQKLRLKDEIARLESEQAPSA